MNRLTKFWGLGEVQKSMGRASKRAMLADRILNLTIAGLGVTSALPRSVRRVRRAILHALKEGGA